MILNVLFIEHNYYFPKQAQQQVTNEQMKMISHCRADFFSDQKQVSS